MAYYNNSPFGAKAILANAGSTTYLFGSRAVTGGEMFVTAVAINGNVATVSVSSWAGYLPVVGTPVTVMGTSVGGGAANVIAVPLTAVALDVNGNGTLSYPVTAANVASTPDGGKLAFRPIVTGDAIANGASIPASPAFNQGRTTNSYAVDIQFPTIPTAATVVFQGAMRNDDADFVTITNVASVSGGVVNSFGNPLIQTSYPFVRFLVSGVSGAGTIAASLTF